MGIVIKAQSAVNRTAILTWLVRQGYHVLSSYLSVSRYNEKFPHHKYPYIIANRGSMMIDGSGNGRYSFVKEPSIQSFITKIKEN